MGTKTNTAIQQQLFNWGEQLDVPGAVIMLQKDGEVIHQSCHGMQNVERQIPMDFDSIFRIQSMTKPITTTGLMLLWEEEKLRLDDPVSRWIPEFDSIPVFAGKDKPLEQQEQKITVRQLLTHSAGFSYGSYDDPVDEQYRSLFKELGLPESPNHTDPVPLKEFVERLSLIPLAFQPGTSWRYSFSIDIIGYLIELISGEPLDEFLSTRIFQPLGMVDTGFMVPLESVDRLTAAYLKREGKVICVEPPQTSRFTQTPRFLEGGGGMVSTPKDYLTFLQMLMNHGEWEGRAFLKASTTAMMMENQLPAALLPISFQHSNILDGCGFGFGFDVLVDREQSSRNCPTGSVSWSGAASTGFWIDPQEEIIGMVFAQCFPNLNLQLEMMKQVYE